jgi:CheY-like chemotaxis protein
VFFPHVRAVSSAAIYVCLQERKHIIIAMTADVLTQTVERCVQSGMDDYFPKPIRKQEFYKVVSAWAEHAQQNFIAQPDDTGTAAGKRAGAFI